MKFGKLAAMALGAVAMMAVPALAGDQDFQLINKTGYTIDEVYVSPHNTSDWQEDVLGEDTLEDSNNVKIRFSRNTDNCVWDLKVVYDDKTSAEWGNFNLCTITQISIFYNEKSGKTSATWK